MRSRGFWSTLLAATLCAMGAGRDASAYDVWVETVDWVPTSSVVSAPPVATSYVVPTTFASPFYATSYATGSLAWEPTAAYVTPSRYVASSYVVPTYYETRFRRSLFGRRLIPTGTRAVYAPTVYAPTTYLPTTLIYPSSYVVPTVLSSRPAVVDRGVIATAYAPSSGCCGDAVLAPTPTTRVIEREVEAPRAAAPARRAPEAAAEEDDLSEAPSLSSEVDPAPPVRSRPAQPPKQAAPATPRTPAEAKPAGESSTPPAPQAPERSTARPNEVAPAPAGAAPKADDLPAPTSPSGTDDILPAPTDMGFNTTGRRDALRPTYPAARGVDPARLNVLFGRVRERETGEVEEGVKVVLTSRSGAFADRPAYSDAFGRFAVRVPDGDWTVRVSMPSGRVYAVSEITVSQGLITDSEGRDVPSLTITR